MSIRKAVAYRIRELCDENGITLHALAMTSGVPPMTVYSMMNTKSKNPGIVTIKMLCDGLGITLTEFFDSDLFRNLEQEIK